MWGKKKIWSLSKIWLYLFYSCFYSEPSATITLNGVSFMMLCGLNKKLGHQAIN